MWLSKEDKRPKYYRNRVNAGLHVIDPEILDAVDGSRVGEIDQKTGKIIKIDLDRQLLKPLAGQGKMFCYDSPEYVKDMGTPERFHQVETDFIAGRVEKRIYQRNKKQCFLIEMEQSMFTKGS